MQMPNKHIVETIVEYLMDVDEVESIAANALMSYYANNPEDYAQDVQALKDDIGEDEFNLVASDMDYHLLAFEIRTAQRLRNANFKLDHLGQATYNRLWVHGIFLKDVPTYVNFMWPKITNSKV